MDWLAPAKKFSETYSKYKYVLLIVAVGILFMLIPSGMEEPAQPATESVPEFSENITEELCQILGYIQGVGKVKIMITEMTSTATVYQVDTERTESADDLHIRTETVITSSGSEERGLIQTITPPTYLGAIIVCQGADDATVRLAVATAVSDVTGIGMDRISVLKMK